MYVCACSPARAHESMQQHFHAGCMRNESFTIPKPNYRLMNKKNRKTKPKNTFKEYNCVLIYMH